MALKIYRSVPMPDGSVALEIDDDAQILATPAGWCRRCNQRALHDPKGVHVCSRCRGEAIPGRKGERIRERERLERGRIRAPKRSTTYGAGTFTKGRTGA